MATNTLSFDDGLLLSKISGGKWNNDYIYLNNKPKKDDEIIKHIKLPSGKFQQMPTNKKDTTDVCFISGARGSGKSYFVSTYLKNYSQMYPENKIFVFSEGEHDKNLDNLVDKWFVVREEPEQGGELPKGKSYYPKDGIPYYLFNKPCCIVFDDIDELEDSKEYKGYSNIYSLAGKLIQNSRKNGITILQTAHFTTDQYKTKKILNGCSSFTWFINDWTNNKRFKKKIWFKFRTN